MSKMDHDIFQSSKVATVENYFVFAVFASTESHKNLP